MQKTNESKTSKPKKEAGEAKPETKTEAVEIKPVVLPEVTDAIQVPVDYKTKITRNQVEIIKSQIAKGASDDELKMFLYVCERTGLDPFTKQVHLVPRWDGRLGKEVRSVIVGIDGLRSIAERTGLYAGNTDPIMGDKVQIDYMEGPKNKEVKKTMDVPTSATATVKKIVQGVICDFTATAKWTEYYPGDRQGMMWRKMPDNMLGKCAEAKALRKAFPAVMSGLYVAEEMHQAGVGTKEPSPEQQQAALFAKAKASLAKVTDKAKLEEYRDGFEQSDKYTEEQRAELVEIINQKLAAK